MTQIRDIMTSQVETCSLLDNVFEAAVKMRDTDVGGIPILDENRLVGLITDRDIVVRCIADKKPPSTKVEEIMTTGLVTVPPDITTEAAADLMSQHQIRRLPVVENGQLAGIVALGDLAVRQLTDSQAQSALSDISESEEGYTAH